jgi:hypothetical protein
LGGVFFSEEIMEAIKDLLRGFRVDMASLQVVANMAVVPLVSDQEFTSRVGDVDEVVLNRDIDYGTMQFKNQSGEVGIVLQGATIVTKQAAQDRTIPRAVILKGKAIENVNAFCVQSTQGGYVDASRVGDEFGDESPFFVIPPTLRGHAMAQSRGGGSGYSTLWKTLEKYTGSFSGVRSSSHIRDIYDTYRSQLDTFVAQFEPVPNQLGAVVIIDRQVVAVDIMPTFRSWKVMWRGLIRDSYGVEAMQTAGAGKGEVWHYDLNAGAVSDLESLRSEMHRTLTGLVAAVRQSWEDVDKEALVTSVDNEISGIRLVNIESERFQGQAVVHDEHTVYLSLIPKESTRGAREAFRRANRRSQTYRDGDFTF